MSYLQNDMKIVWINKKRRGIAEDIFVKSLLAVIKTSRAAPNFSIC